MVLLRKILFFILILLLPTQLGLHFWPSFAFQAGFRIDYLSPVIYLFDLIALPYLFLSVSQLKKSFSHSLTKKIFLVIFVTAVINIIFSLFPLLAIYSWFRFFLQLLIFLTLYPVNLSSSQFNQLKKALKTPLLISTITLLFVEFAQLAKQASLNGFFYYLGERSFSLSTPNLAKIDTTFICNSFNVFCSPTLFIRPYSVFSHPNSLAGYLLLTFLILDFFKKTPFVKFTKMIVFVGILLTFSKAAFLTLLLILFVGHLNSFGSSKFLSFSKALILIGILVSLTPLLAPLLLSSFNPLHTPLLRLNLGFSTVDILKNNFLTGVGLGNYVPAVSQVLNSSFLQSWTLQPVHSLPLLFLSELGLPGIVALVFFLTFSSLRRFKYSSLSLPLILLLVIVFLTGSVDHYWWTLVQNQHILVIASALILNHHLVFSKQANNKS